MRKMEKKDGKLQSIRGEISDMKVKKKYVRFAINWGSE